LGLRVDDILVTASSKPTAAEEGPFEMRAPMGFSIRREAKDRKEKFGFHHCHSDVTGHYQIIFDFEKRYFLLIIAFFESIIHFGEIIQLQGFLNARTDAKKTRLPTGRI
jgi:hypothetical protein